MSEKEKPVSPQSESLSAENPWQWLHDNGFSWDDVNAIASILGAGGYDITLDAAREQAVTEAHATCTDHCACWQRGHDQGFEDGHD